MKEETKEVKKSELHSLKSTLSAIMGYIQMAQKKVESCDDEVTQQVNAMLLKALEASNTLNEKVQELEGVDEPLMDL